MEREFEQQKRIRAKVQKYIIKKTHCMLFGKKASCPMSLNLLCR